jgi:hypothetical protein
MSVTVGGIVSIPVRYRRVLPVRHVGLVSDQVGADGHPMIIHASDRYGRVVESTLSDFVRHRAGPLAYHGYLGRLHPDEVLARARHDLGMPYHPWRANCEHLVARAAGEEETSPQLLAGATAATFLVGVVSSIVGGIIVAAVGSRR